MINAIFKNQAAILHETYGLEVENGSNIMNINHALNTAGKQALIREYQQRIMEEIYEASQAHRRYVGVSHPESKSEFLEEMIDILNFSTNLMLICGFKAKDIHVPTCIYSPNTHPHLNEQLWRAGEYLHDAVSLLKIKPWRRNPPHTDERVFKERLSLFYTQILTILKLEMTSARIVLVQQEKHDKCLERINGNY